MSKSRGNIAPISQLLAEHGADLVRLNISAAGEGMDDADWRNETIPTYRKHLEFLHETTLKLLSGGGFKGTESGRPEKLLESRLNASLKKASAFMDSLKLRSAVHTIVFEALSALKAYVHLKTESANSAVVRTAVGQLTLMLAPFTPHLSEELWRLLGKQGFCSHSQYPEADASKINVRLEQEEKYAQDLLEDIRKIIAFTKASPKIIRLYSAPAWQTRLLQFAIEDSGAKGKFDLPALIKGAMAQEKFKAHSKSLPSLLQAIGKSVNYYKSAGIPEYDEFALLKENIPAFEALFSCKVEVFPAEKVPEGLDPAKRAQRALPLKPAIYLQAE